MPFGAIQRLKADRQSSRVSDAVDHEARLTFLATLIFARFVCIAIDFNGVCHRHGLYLAVSISTLARIRQVLASFASSTAQVTRSTRYVKPRMLINSPLRGTASDFTTDRFFSEPVR